MSHETLDTTYDLFGGAVAATDYVAIPDAVDVPAGKQCHGFSLRGVVNSVAGMWRTYEYEVTVNNTTASANVYGVIGGLWIGGAGTAKGSYGAARGLPNHTGVLVGGNFSAVGAAGSAIVWGVQCSAEGPASHVIHMNGSGGGGATDYGIVMDDSVTLNEWFIQQNQRIGGAGKGFCNLRDPNGKVLFSVDAAGALQASRVTLPSAAPPNPRDGDIWRQGTQVKVRVAGRTITLAFDAPSQSWLDWLRGLFGFRAATPSIGESRW